MSITGTKVSLRPLAEADANEVYLGWLNDPEVTRWLEVGRAPSTPETLRRYLERFRDSETDFIFAICDAKTGKHIGNVTINNIDRAKATADSGIMLGDKAYWGRGYAYEAWGLILDYAFKKLGLKKIMAGAEAANTASLKLQEKLGFKVEGSSPPKAGPEDDHSAIRTAIFQPDLKFKLLER